MQALTSYRKTTWEHFQHHKGKNERQRELDIRNEFRATLAVCLEDAFFELAEKGDKLDLYELGEPDIIIMTRGVGSENAKNIAKKGQTLFKEETKLDVTIAVLCNKELTEKKRTASKLDREAERRLNTAKKYCRGTVYPCCV